MTSEAVRRASPEIAPVTCDTPPVTCAPSPHRSGLGVTSEAVRRASSEVARRRSSHSATAHSDQAGDGVSGVKSDATIAGGRARSLFVQTVCDSETSPGTGSDVMFLTG